MECYFPLKVSEFLFLDCFERLIFLDLNHEEYHQLFAVSYDSKEIFDLHLDSLVTLFIRDFYAVVELDVLRWFQLSAAEETRYLREFLA